jgi:DNA sulfur modification protein DndC
VSLINEEERARIEELIAANTWPNKWTGEEMPGNTLLPEMFPDGSIQKLLFGE